MYKFLSHTDYSAKGDIILFTTAQGSRPSPATNINKMQSGSTVKKRQFAVSGIDAIHSASSDFQSNKHMKIKDSNLEFPTSYNHHYRPTVSTHLDGLSQLKQDDLLLNKTRSNRAIQFVLFLSNYASQNSLAEVANALYKLNENERLTFHEECSSFCKLDLKHQDRAREAVSVLGLPIIRRALERFPVVKQ